MLTGKRYIDWTHAPGPSPHSGPLSVPGDKSGGAHVADPTPGEPCSGRQRAGSVATHLGFTAVVAGNTIALLSVDPDTGVCVTV